MERLLETIDNLSKMEVNSESEKYIAYSIYYLSKAYAEKMLGNLDTNNEKSQDR
jgi:hypothetical protein